MSVARALSTLALALSSLFALACDNAFCEAGEPCECTNRDQCFFECEGSGCDMACSAMTTCGTVCENDCSVDCHDVSDCSSSCGDHCTIDCHNLDDCGVICGADCDTTCEDSNRCGVRAGPNSTVDCTDVSSCVVECEGRCAVTCLRVGGDGCTVRCANGDDPTSCPGGIQACGSCP